MSEKPSDLFGEAKFSSHSSDLYWSIFIDGSSCRWIGYDDSHWWSKVAPSEQFQVREHESNYYRLNPETNEVFILPNAEDNRAVSDIKDTILQWHKGPARDGSGTAETKDGIHYWADGDLLLIIVETNSEPETAVVRVSADGLGVDLSCSITGDCFGRIAEEISWWARIEECLPVKEVRGE